jgi:ABC-type lipoprotein release transport system permease subunit
MRLGLGPAVTGIALGGVLAWWGSGVLRGLLFGVEPRDPLTFAPVALLIALSAAGACLVPAWRAALVDPLITMRSR